MIHQIIRDNIGERRRITIPNLGCILLNGGQVLFLEFADTDDDLLLSLLIERGVGEFDAVASIESFVAEAHSAMSDGGGFLIEGVGTLVRGVDGSISFGDSDPCVVVEESMAERVTLPEPTPEPTPDPTPDPTPEPTLAPILDPIQAATSEEVIEEVERAEKPSKRSMIESLYGVERTRKSANVAATASSETPDPMSQSAPQEVSTPVSSKSGGVDFLMLISFVAIGFAICLILYSFFIQWQIGELVLPESIDRVMIRIFGDGMSAIQNTVVE